MRPVVPQDRAAAAARAVFALVALLVALPVWERPVAATVLVVLAVGYFGVGLRSRPWKPARTWVADLSEVPRVSAAVASTSRSVGVGLALGALGGGVLLVLTVVAERDTPGSALLLVPSGLVVGRAVDRLLVTRAVRRWEREQGVVLCRHRAPNRTGVELFHEADVERMVAVPVSRTGARERPPR